MNYNPVSDMWVLNSFCAICEGNVALDDNLITCSFFFSLQFMSHLIVPYKRHWGDGLRKIYYN